MASVNKVILVGNLGRDPEMRSLPNGDAVANISIATADRWRDKTSGETREATEWHRVVFFRRTAEVVGQYLRKGSQVYVEGRLRTRKWQDDKGQDRYSTEIIGDVMQMLGSRQGQGQPEPLPHDGKSDWGTESAPPPRRGNEPPSDGSFRDMDDDIPF